MGRLGLLPEEVPDFVHSVRSLPGLNLEGIFTHFSIADDADLSYTCGQLERFQNVLEVLKAQGITFPLVHAANSAALLRLPESRFTMVRLGLAMYGLAPSAAVPLPANMRRALTWKTTVAQVKRLPPGSFLLLATPIRRGLGDHRCDSRRLRGWFSARSAALVRGVGQGPAGTHRRARLHGSDDDQRQPYSRPARR
jgi:hypothetical protein